MLVAVHHTVKIPPSSWYNAEGLDAMMVVSHFVSLNKTARPVNADPFPQAQYDGKSLLSLIVLDF